MLTFVFLTINLQVQKGLALQLLVTCDIPLQIETGMGVISTASNGSSRYLSPTRKTEAV